MNSSNTTVPLPVNFEKYSYEAATLLRLYKALIKPRMIEEKMLKTLRQGKISKWFAGIGQEAIAVGATEAMAADEYILPMHRNLGVFTSREVKLRQLFGQFQGKTSGFTQGRDRSFHFGSKQHHIVGMISHLATQLSVANGIALGSLLKGAPKVTLAFTGEGATSEGEFHEAMNIAAVWGLPVIFLVENNGYGLSTPTKEQYRCTSLVDKGIGYGMDAVQIDGNNILEVYHTVSHYRKSILENPRPVLIEAMTFRMRGHEEASGTAYVPQELFEKWQEKDPVLRYEEYLFNQGALTLSQKEETSRQIKSEIAEALQEAFAEPLPPAHTTKELQDCYAPFHYIPVPFATQKKEIRFVDAITEGLYESMKRFPNLILMGQDIAEYGGVFKITKGFVEEFGKQRVRNTPLCESGILGLSLGLSISGHRSMVEMQFADFVSCGFNQIVNNLAKSHYRWGEKANVVIRMPTGAGVGAGPYHSQSNEAWFFHTPGLKIVYPSSPEDAKGLLTAAFEDPNPVLYFEHKALYRSMTESVSEGYYNLPIGKARLVAQGDELSVITYGMGVHWALELTQALGIAADILDLRTLLPWDKEAVMESVRKTNKVLVCHEDCLTGGIGSEIAAWIGENCFQWLDAPVMREGSLDTPVPFSKNLEENFLPKNRIREKLKTLREY
ncbi:dehydrogenase E1 component subunit alpha/beta [Rapidithrix thailandica]|uniref:Dehydrogenase E1 component subunit alpha/beta n=1 Tax=Rapidithrix thailandica TaxID=413964 RepID=A0AAW9SHR9_9BACT